MLLEGYIRDIGGTPEVIALKHGGKDYGVSEVKEYLTTFYGNQMEWIRGRDRCDCVWPKTMDTPPLCDKCSSLKFLETVISEKAKTAP